MLRIWLASFLALALAACASVGESPAAKRIALTFDDTPRHQGAFLGTDERTEMLRKTLREGGVEQAAFFINPGKMHERANSVDHIMAYMADGHVMANHTATHAALSETTLKDYLAEIDEAEKWVAQLSGHRPWFRYPYLDEGHDDVAKRDGVRAGLAERGLSNGYVTVGASDWFYDAAASEAVKNGRDLNMPALGALFVESHVEAAEFYDALAVKTLGRSPAHVMLLHEADVTVLYLADLVDALKAKGWTIISADEAFADPIAPFAATYDTPSAYGNLIEQIAWERGIPAPRGYPRNNPETARAEFDSRVLGVIAE